MHNYDLMALGCSHVGGKIVSVFLVLYMIPIVLERPRQSTGLSAVQLGEPDAFRTYIATSERVHSSPQRHLNLHATLSYPLPVLFSRPP